MRQSLVAAILQPSGSKNDVQTHSRLRCELYSAITDNAIDEDARRGDSSSIVRLTDRVTLDISHLLDETSSEN